MTITKDLAPRRRDVARITTADVWLEDHGFLVLDMMFDYGGSTQGLGLILNDHLGDFVRNILRVCKRERLSRCVGVILQVESDHSHIFRLTQLPFDGEETFDIEAWRQGIKD